MVRLVWSLEQVDWQTWVRREVETEVTVMRARARARALEWLWLEQLTCSCIPTQLGAS